MHARARQLLGQVTPPAWLAGAALTLLIAAGALVAGLITAGTAIRARVEAAERDMELAREREKQIRPLLEAFDLARQQSLKQIERKEKLLLLRAIPREELEKAQAASRQAEADYLAAQARLAEVQAAAAWAEKIAQSEKEAAVEELEKERSEVRLLEAERDGAQVKLRQLEIRAPQAGVVSRVLAKVGDGVGPSDLVLSIADPAELWVEAYIGAEDLANLKEGQEAHLMVQTRPLLKGVGKVSLPLHYEKEKSALRVGPQEAPSPSAISGFIYPVKVSLPPELAKKVRPEMIVKIRIRRM
jgi:multidrug resistance efflux pump